MPDPGTPDPVELFQSAADSMLSILAGIRPGQFDLPTPCTDWNVRQLINHNLRGCDIARSLFSGEGFQGNPMDVSGPLPDGGAAAAFRDASAGMLDAFRLPGVAQGNIAMPGMEMPSAQFLMLMFGDVLIHTWDLAKATGQDTPMDSDMADTCYRIMEPQMEGARQMGMFGPAVAVRPDACSRDRLLGLTGRTP